MKETETRGGDSHAHISNTEALEQEGNKGFWYTQGTAVDTSTAAATASTSAAATKEETAEASAASNENARWFEAAMDKFDERCKAEVRLQRYYRAICLSSSAKWPLDVFLVIYDAPQNA